MAEVDRGGKLLPSEPLQYGRRPILPWPVFTLAVVFTMVVFEVPWLQDIVEWVVAIVLFVLVGLGFFRLVFRLATEPAD